jgi:hypothetical protein
MRSRDFILSGHSVHRKYFAMLFLVYVTTLSVTHYTASNKYLIKNLQKNKQGRMQKEAGGYCLGEMAVTSIANLST